MPAAKLVIFMQNSVIRKSDLILIAVLIVAALILGGIWMATRDEGACAIVTVNGDEVEKLPLNKDTEIRIGDEENYNIVVIKDGVAYVSEASCPDKVCVKTGKISLTGETIVCLPNKMTVKIEGGEDLNMDGISQ